MRPELPLETEKAKVLVGIAWPSGQLSHEQNTHMKVYNLSNLAKEREIKG
jgi:hypothetical protein